MGYGSMGYGSMEVVVVMWSARLVFQDDQSTQFVLHPQV
jgi:hypothetical protein